MSQLETPSKSVSEYPFNSVEGDLFPPVCLKSHWDPTMMLRHILPTHKVELPQDFRPWTKVCKNYVTSGPAIKAPMPPSNMVFPMGGEFYPPGRYAAAIDDESKLRTLNWRLDKWCDNGRYVPPLGSDTYVPNVNLPDRAPTSSAFVQELAMPQALLRSGPYNCRTENDVAYFDRSPRFFNNPTKQDRYGAGRFSALPGGVTPMPHGGVNKVPLTEDAIKAAYPRVPMPGGRPASGEMYALKTSNNMVLPNTKSPGISCTSIAGVATCGSFAPV